MGELIGKYYTLLNHRDVSDGFMADRASGKGGEGGEEEGQEKFVKGFHEPAFKRPRVII
jgi:hypothetical protein